MNRERAAAQNAIDLVDRKNTKMLEEAKGRESLAIPFVDVLIFSTFQVYCELFVQFKQNKREYMLLEVHVFDCLFDQTLE